MSEPTETLTIRQPERQLPVLPPVDTGRKAWLFVLSSFVVEVLVWGPLASNGVFLKYYAATEPFSKSSETTISLIGTLSLFAGYATGLPLLYMYNRYPRQIKPSFWFGLMLYCASLFGASFARRTWLLVIFQGVLPGLAACLSSFPFIRWLPEWFDKRKGTAAGIIFAGGGVGGAFMPIVYQYAIDHLGSAWLLRITALTTAVLGGIAIHFINPRIPITATRDVARMPMPPFFSTFLHAGFFGCFLTTLLQGFGYFNVGLFLPRFSDSLDSTAGAGLLSGFNISCIIAQVLWGFLSDRMSPPTAMALSSSIGCLLVFTMWGFGGTVGLPVFAPFAVLFGVATGGFTAMWSQSAHAIAGPDREQQTMLFSGFSIARGLGAALGPTVGAALYQSHTTPSARVWGSAGSPGLVSLVAVSLASSAVVGLLFARGEYVSKRIMALAKRVKGGGRQDEFELPERVI